MKIIDKSFLNTRIHQIVEKIQSVHAGISGNSLYSHSPTWSEGKLCFRGNTATTFCGTHLSYTQNTLSQHLARVTMTVERASGMSGTHLNSVDFLARYFQQHTCSKKLTATLLQQHTYQQSKYTWREKKKLLFVSTKQNLPLPEVLLLCFFQQTGDNCEENQKISCTEVKQLILFEGEYMF